MAYFKPYRELGSFFLPITRVNWLQLRGSFLVNQLDLPTIRSRSEFLFRTWEV